MRVLRIVSLKIASCFKEGNNSIIIFICAILPRDDISSINCLFIKEANNFLKSSCSVNHISVKNYYESRNNYQLSKTYKSVTAFSLNNADFPTLTPLSFLKPVYDCISVAAYKSLHNFFIKPVQKPSYISSIKPVPAVFRKCSVYSSSLGARINVSNVSLSMLLCVSLFLVILMLILLLLQQLLF